MGLLGRGPEAPPRPERREGGHRESRVGELHDPALRQAEHDRDREGKRRGDREQEGIKGEVAHRVYQRTPAAKAQRMTTPPRNQ